MSNTNIIHETNHTTHINNDLRKSATVLDTEPHDNASKFRVTGGTSMRSSHTVRNSTNENKAIAEFNRTSTQELKIDPTILATRVSIPTGAMSKETRINTTHENAINAQLDNNEVLDLNPTQHKTRAKGAAMNNSEPRFNTHNENTVLNELHTTYNTNLNATAPEILIIEPTDKSIKKNNSTVKFSGANTGRGGSVQKESVTERNKNTVTDTNNGKRGTSGSAAAGTSGSGTNRITSKATTNAAGAASGSSGSSKARTTTPTGTKRPTTTTSTTTKNNTTTGKNNNTSDGPGTPVLTVPELSMKPPTFKKLSQKDLNSINEL
eukprot:GDKK01033785.1.p1 GENE.GDKK01033785.1~~GDKK01033785.1.p1  ORF type:complete len:322 (-),score=3.51 GDKK01033785.1:235-1200(-)